MHYLDSLIQRAFHRAAKTGQATVKVSRTQYLTVIRLQSKTAIRLTTSSGPVDPSVATWIRAESGWAITSEVPDQIGITWFGTPPDYPVPVKKPARKGAKKCA